MKLDNVTINRSTKGINSISWQLSPEDIEKEIGRIISDTQSGIDAIIAIDDNTRTFENTVLAFENVEADLRERSDYLEFLSFVSTDARVREASAQARSEFAKYKVERKMNVGLFKAIKTVYEKNPSLSKEEQWLFDRILRGFKRNGLDLDSENQEKLKNIRKQIADLKVQFGQTLNNWSEKITFTPEELEGVPENTMKILKKDSDGNYTVGMSYPEVIPILEYAKKPSTRKRMKIAFSNRGGPENVERLEKLIELRSEAAIILGYDNHASFIHEIRMAKTPQNVIAFLTDLENKLRKGGQEELEELIKLKNDELGAESDGIIHHYDWRYYTRMNKERKYKVDDTEVKKYFPLQTVIEGMLTFYQKVLGLTFTKIDAPTWHEDVTVYAVSDKEKKEFIGQFYLDLFPRDGKYNHAAAFDLVGGRELPSGKYQATAAAMVCNFNKPTEKDPSLLPHSDVETLFHEFGHIMHQVVTKARYSRFSGARVKWDFVETPSTMLQNWVWEPVVLKQLSSHYQTGKPLPDELVDKIVKAKNANAALHYLRQLFFGNYDLAAHTSDSIEAKKVWDELHKKLFLIDTIEGTLGPASFNHTVNNYDAGYYSYLWSEVYAQDMYTRFKKAGITSTEIGKAFRKEILEPGGSTDEMNLIVNFLGREPNNKAFLKSIGL
ncbi:MAG: M3 family metallopeptidase [Candidatus Odinarchaeota archaeon]